MISGGSFAEIARAYADRVHDDVRRLGVSPAAAAEIVEQSALEVLAKPFPASVAEAVGLWFRSARELALRVGGDEPADAPGLLGSTDEERSAREALAARPADEREALLLRDSYDLPYAAVGTALGLDAKGAAAVVARARLGLARAAFPSGHVVELGRLARLVDGRLSEDEHRAATRHTARCEVCGAAAPAMRDARRRIAGLAILALPDAERDTILERVGEAAARLLPTDEEVAARLAADESRRGRPSPVTVLGSLIAALVFGSVAGLAFGGGRAPGGQAGDNGYLDGRTSPTPSVTASPSPSASASPSVTRSATPSVTATPSRTSTPSPTPTVSETTSPPTFGTATITVTPSSGPNCTRLRVTGRSWRPGANVTVTYRDLTGQRVLRSTTATADQTGRFTAGISACDSSLILGPHVVRATGGGSSDDATFTATS